MKETILVRDVNGRQASLPVEYLPIEGGKRTLVIMDGQALNGQICMSLTNGVEEYTKDVLESLSINPHTCVFVEIDSEGALDLIEFGHKSFESPTDSVWLWSPQWYPITRNELDKLRGV